MKRNLLVWQMAAGLVICGFALITFFMPRYALDEKKVSSAISGFMNDHVKEIMEIRGSSREEDVRDDIEEEEESIKEGIGKVIDQFDRYGIPYQISSFYIMTHSIKSMVDKAAEKSSISRDFMDVLMGLSGVDEQLEKFSTPYNLFRLYLAATMILPVFVIVGILLAWMGKLKKWFSMAAAWIWIGLEIGYLIMIQFVWPGKVGDSFGISSMAVPEIMSKLLRKILWSFHGSGFILCIVLTFLLLVWTVWCCIQKDAKGFSAVGAGAVPSGNLGFSPLQTVNSNEMAAANPVFSPLQQINGSGAANPEFTPLQPLNQKVQEISPVNNEELPPPNAASQKIVIHGIAGTIIGADINLNAGEKITIGRDPAICQLILSDAKISRKHCSISFLAGKNHYYIECYSANGIYFSNNHKLMAGENIEVERGTRLIMADGREVLELN